MFKAAGFTQKKTKCVTTYSERRQGGDGAAVGSGQGDEGSDVLVLPRLRLTVEEVERHGAAHAVAHQDHLLLQAVPVLRLDQLLELREELALLV